MTQGIKMTPDKEFPALQIELKTLGTVKDLQKPTYIDDGDLVKIVYGKPTFFSKDRPKVDPNKIRFESKSGDGKGTTYGEYAEMKAKSMFFDRICENSSEEVAALVFSTLGDDIFQKNSIFHGDSGKLFETIITKAQALEIKYFNKGLDAPTLEDRQKELMEIQHNLFLRDSGLNKGNAGVDSPELAPALQIRIMDSKAKSQQPALKRRKSAPQAPSAPRQPSSAARPRSKSLDAQQPKKASIQQSKDADFGPAESKNWIVSFDIPKAEGGGVHIGVDLKAWCQEMKEELLNQNRDSEEELNATCKRILESPDEQKQIQSDIQNKLNNKFKDGVRDLEAFVKNGVTYLPEPQVRSVLRSALMRTPDNEWD